MKYTNRNNGNNITPLSEVPMQVLLEEVQRRLSDGEMVLIGAGDDITTKQIEWLEHTLLLLKDEAVDYDDCDSVCDCGCDGDCSECANEYTAEDMSDQYDFGFDAGVEYVKAKLHALLDEVED